MGNGKAKWISQKRKSDIKALKAVRGIALEKTLTLLTDDSNDDDNGAYDDEVEVQRERKKIVRQRIFKEEKKNCYL
jgi:hypothetical protein